ncbi:MAG: hypothetical protein C3F11_01910 [Methylocystaceae bacterium]|nr:MAG: hypothetical protein C3F11_01910 [Methylocystaceae bacterium]
MVDGEVVTCANMFAENVGQLGRPNSFLSIWDGERMQSVRNSLNTKFEWKQCQTCWFREIRYHSQREAWARREFYELAEGSDYRAPSWDFRRYREAEEKGRAGSHD